MKSLVSFLNKNKTDFEKIMQKYEHDEISAVEFPALTIVNLCYRIPLNTVKAKAQLDGVVLREKNTDKSMNYCRNTSKLPQYTH